MLAETLTLQVYYKTQQVSTLGLLKGAAKRTSKESNGECGGSNALQLWNEDGLHAKMHPHFPK